MSDGDKTNQQASADNGLATAQTLELASEGWCPLRDSACAGAERGDGKFLICGLAGNPHEAPQVGRCLEKLNS